jgi:adenylosuccinate synthase
VSTLAVIGAQWGDEGKGKVVDRLAEHADVVVRFHGGNNAGHTLVVGGERTVLHLIPSGVLHAGTVCVIGNGVVVDPEVAVAELAALRARGYLLDDACLKISEQAHVIMPYHRAIDRARERLRGAGKIGTTGRGIGPAYEDKMARVGIRFADLMDEEAFRETLTRNLEEKNIYLAAILGEKTLDFQEIFDRYCGYRDALSAHVTNTSRYLDDAIRSGRRVLFEGAQGTMLDVDHGTYPYVTSSNTVAGAVAAGAGIAPQRIRAVVGISKAYATRVGSGPFPTELTDAIGDKLRHDGDEFGATTGRPRRCGWFDAVVVREAVRLNGLTGIALTKLDVLRGITPLRLCTGYTLDGERLAYPPASGRAWARLHPVYEELDGWTEGLSAARRLEDLPAAVRRYVTRLEELVGAPVVLISVGAGREETIVLRDAFAAPA